jgi:hypothetical protein
MGGGAVFFNRHYYETTANSILNYCMMPQAMSFAGI